MVSVPDSPEASLADRVRSAGDPELRLLAARGVLPLPPRELIPLQVEMARGEDADLARTARAALGELDPRVAATYVGRDAGPDELSWFAAESEQATVIEAVLRRRDVPRSLLVGLAPRLSPDLQEILVRRQDAIVEEPGIADALESNPQLTSDVRRRLGEYRRHLLRRETLADYVPPLPAEPGEPDDDEVREALLAVSAAPAGPGERDPTTGLSEAQVRMLPAPVRLRLARGASRPLRAILLRDSNPVVAKAVLHGNTFGDQEIEQVASIRSMHEEVLGEIAIRREWVGLYRVVVALVHNPRTPLGAAVRLVPRLSVRDLRLLSRDRNVPDAVRSTAKRLYTIKRA